MDTNSLVGVQSLASIGQGRQQQLLPPLGGGTGGPAVVAWNNIHSAAAVATTCNITALTRTITSQTTMDQSSTIAATLQCQFTGNIMGMSSAGIGGTSTAATAFSSSPHSGGGEGGWSSAELITGTALLFAGAAAAASVGSIFLGPNVDDSGLRGKKKTNNVDGEGGGKNGNGGGSGGSKKNGSGGPGGGGAGGSGGDKYQLSFDSSAKEQDDKDDILGLKEAAAPRAYEVSVSHTTKAVM
jgi:hypothetical protein